MSFNSLFFVIFLLSVCLLMRIVKGKQKRILLVSANIVFYSSNSIFSICLLFLTVVLTYVCGIFLYKRRKRSLLFVGVTLLLVPLFLYKYFNFIVGLFDIKPVETFSLLPLGISFYTFQAIGYIVDVYKAKIEPERNIINLALFLSMFFCYGGPIERTNNLLTQIREMTNRNEEIPPERYSIGFRRLLYGCFLKVFVAETIALVVNPVYSNYSSYSGAFLLFSTALFGMQLYCDFSGYSLMALGTASCLGFDIINNFNSPYLSVSVTDFWRRWHISLSIWFRDYVYFPLGGSRCSKMRAHFNRLITFSLSGVWHGANLTFLIWGFLNGLFLCFESALGIKDVNKRGAKAKIGRIYSWILINISWVFFRASSLNDAIGILHKVITETISDIISVVCRRVDINSIIPIGVTQLYTYFLIFVGLVFVITADVYRYKTGDISIALQSWSVSKRWVLYFTLGVLLMVFGAWTTAGNFIYSNF